MNTHRPDDEHLPGEDELAGLYRKLPRKEPGPALDAAVLRAAARAVETAVPAKPRTRWPVALGSAAALVLAAGLGWRMRDMPASAPPAAPAAMTVQEKAQVPANAPVAAKMASEPSTAPAADAVAGAPPPPPAAPRAVPSQRAAMATLGKPEAPSPNAGSERQTIAPSLAAPGVAAEAMPAAAPPTPAPATRMAAAPTMQRMVTAAPMMAPVPAPPADTARDPADTPIQELDKIRRLFAGNHRDEARQRLADFHRDHPDYPLPDDLREQLLTP